MMRPISLITMNPTNRTPALILALITGVATPLPSVRAQDYFRQMETQEYVAPATPQPVNPNVDLGRPNANTDSFTSTDAYGAVPPPLPQEEERYNMALGAVRFNLAAGIGVEFNDNISLSPSGSEQEDIIIRPSIIMDATWRLSELNTLRFSLGLSYAKYLNNSQYDTDGVLVSPTSELAMSFYVGNVRITVRDKFSYQEDPYDLPVLNNTATYRRLENDAGLQVDWMINDLVTLTAGYSHYNLWTFDSEFESLERSVDTFYLRPSVQVGPGIRLGVNGSVSLVNFKQDVQNDGTTYFVGPFIEAELTENTKVYLEAGWQQFNFDDNGTVQDNEDSSSFYVRAEILNRLSEAFSHRLGFTKSTEVGFGSNYYDLYHAEYAANWKITPDLIISPTAFYEYYETSDGDGAFIGETASRFGAAIGLRYILTPSLTLGLDYRFLLKDSDLDSASYKQNLVLLSIYYNF